MLKHYLKVAFRSLRRQFGYSIINIAGLTIGLTISLVIAFYVIDDLTYDNFHENADDIYRVLTIEKTNSDNMTYSITAGPLIPAAKDEIPEVISAVRCFAIGNPLVAAGRVDPQNLDQNNGIRLRGYLTEREFFDIFSFEVLQGDRENILQDPNGIVITQNAAELLFNGQNPIGKEITIPGIQNTFVSAVVESPPTNSHIQFDFIIPLRVENNPLWWDSWENLMLQAYVRLDKMSSIPAVEEKMRKIATANNMPEIYIPKLQPLLDVHLGSSHHRYDGSNFGKNDETVVYALAVIGFLILLVAAINFINLSSARASKRAREVGMRKVIGSNKSMLIGQFLGESVFLTMISMFFSVIILQFTIPYLDEILGKTLNISFIANPLLLLLMLLVALVVGILSGIYPAFVLSSFKPVTVLRGSFQRSKVGGVIRKFLVLFQFGITISLITVVLVIVEQIEYLKSLDMGYSRDQVVTMFVPPNGGEVFRDQLTSLPGVKTVGKSSGILGSDFIRYEVIPEGATRVESQMFLQLAIDEGFFDVLEIKMAKGRNFSRNFTSDTTEAVLLNETAAKKAGWDDPIGKRIDLVEVDGSINSKRVIGVVKDFHFTSARQEIEPLFFQLNSQNTFLTSIKLRGGQINQTMDEIENIYSASFPNANFNFQFLDDVFDRQFEDDREFATNIGYFSGFAIFIACLGLIGLVAFAVEQRRGEIAVRKVLGSSEWSIVFLLAQDFLKWVLIANIIAWPLSYYAIGLWLNGFVYKVSLDVLPFLIAGLSALIIALFTISFQSIRAALANPVNSLRNE